MAAKTDIQRIYNTFFRLDSPIPYQIDTDVANTYMRWSDDDVNAVFIRKVNVNGNITTNTYAFDLWANRATATYVYNFDNVA